MHFSRAKIENQFSLYCVSSDVSLCLENKVKGARTNPLVDLAYCWSPFGLANQFRHGYENQLNIFF